MNDTDKDDVFHYNDTIGQYIIDCPLEDKTKNSIYKAHIDGNEKDFYVIKAIPYYTEKQILVYNKEKSILSELRTEPFIIPIITTIEETVPTLIRENGEEKPVEFKFMCVVTKFCENLDLRVVYEQIISKASLSQRIQARKRIFYQSLYMLKVLHSKNIVHHDIKAQNFLVTKIDPIELALIDFEFAMKIHEPINFNCGTVTHMAPEILQKKKHDISIDIWSLGIMIYYIYFGKYPFKIKREDKQLTVLKKILKYELRFETRMNKDLIDLLRKMLQKEPKNRISAYDALNSPYFSNYTILMAETKEVVDEITRVKTEIDESLKIDDSAYNDGN